MKPNFERMTEDLEGMQVILQKAGHLSAANRINDALRAFPLPMPPPNSKIPSLTRDLQRIECLFNIASSLLGAGETDLYFLYRKEALRLVKKQIAT